MKLKSLLLFVLITNNIFSLIAAETKIVQNSHLSGSWYPNDKTELKKDLDYYFSLAAKYFKINDDSENISALIVPHAGHYFSGLCAATAYQTIKKSSFDRVIIIGPSHHANFNGIALPDYAIYRTPTGDIPVDKDAVSKLSSKNSLFKVIPGAHQKEHSIEIQLPFLQSCLDNFSIVPLIVGNLQAQDFKIIAQAISELLNSESLSETKKTLIVISSDFIHYGDRFGYTPTFDNVAKFDNLAIRAILDKSYTEFDAIIKKTKATICGTDPIKILLKIIEIGALGQIECQITSYYNSAQIEKSRNNKQNAKLDYKLDEKQEIKQSKKQDSKQNTMLENKQSEKQIDVSKLSQIIETESSVSYAGIICKSKMTLKEERTLLNLARNSITNKLFPDKSLKKDFEITDNLRKKSGAFVTLKTKDGNLRGCIGRITSDEPIYKSIPEIALSSALQDSRFEPLTKSELEKISISITVLTPPHTVNSYKDIIIGKHGIILEKTVNGLTRSAVFLPQVAGEQGWDLAETLENLSEKAGLQKDAWKSGCQFKVFEGFEFSE
jgi:AmmeMemoRadiSam system protein B/AmmeMemoRadiSam system protein A